MPKLFSLVSCFGLLLILTGCQPSDHYQFGGYLEAEQIQVGSRVGGRVAEVLVEEGDDVRPGDVIVKFERVHLVAALNEAQSRAKRLEAEWNKVQNGPRAQEIQQAREKLAGMEARLLLSKQKLKRAQELGQKTITKEELEQLTSEQEVALRERNSLEQTLQLLEEGSRAEDKQMASAALEEARAAELRLQDQLEEADVDSPVLAVVEAIDLQPGDLVVGGAAVATLVRKDQLWVRCFVPETLMDTMKPGDQVQVQVDSKRKTYTGTVLRINRVAEFTPRNVQTYEQREDMFFGVKIRVVDPHNELRPGMAATVAVPRAAANSPSPATTKIE